VASDTELLITYCQSVLLVRKAAAAAARDALFLQAWERAARTSAALATRLRLSPQSRLDPRTVARRASGHGMSFYELERENDDDA
jgi:hypothetical protein